jgi:hypothetical protein
VFARSSIPHTSESPRYNTKTTVVTPLIRPAGGRGGVEPRRRVPVPPEALLSSTQHVAFIYFSYASSLHLRNRKNQKYIPLEGYDSGALARTWILSTCCPRGLNLATPRGQGLTSAVKLKKRSAEDGQSFSQEEFGSSFNLSTAIGW